MAKPIKIHLSGKIDNLIFYEFRGKPCARKAPVKVRQTKATKANAKLFGMAVSMSAALRKGLSTVLPVKTGHKNIYRLNTVLLKWLKEIRPATPAPSNAMSALHDFSFNEDCSLHKHLHKAIRVDWSKTGRVVVRFPALTPEKDLGAPSKTQSVIWRIAIASCAVGNPSVLVEKAIAELEMPYDNLPVGARPIELPFSLGGDDLGVVVISLQYLIAKNDYTTLLNNSKWLPVDIIDAAYW